MIFITIGSIALKLAFIFSLLSVLLYFVSFIKGDGNLLSLTSWFVVIVFISLAVAITVLSMSFILSDFRLEYVYEHSSFNLPLAYKIGALWAGQAGSMIFWAFLVSLFAVLEIGSSDKYEAKFCSVVMFCVMATVLFFIFLCIFVSPAFELTNGTPEEGAGLNPLLQHIGMLYHPPILYLGYSSLVFPFAYAVAALLNKDYSTSWLKRGRSWSLFSWCVLTAGIIFGGNWAYTILGWGGYWAWDPVENASIFPWFALTSYLHASILFEKKGRYIFWTYSLAMFSHILAIFGTFLTRSGVIQSVHAFGKSDLGLWFLIHIIVLVVFSVILLLMSSRKFMVTKNINLASNDMLVLYGVIVVTIFNLFIIFGTLFPIISGLFGTQIILSKAYYDRLTIVLMFIAFVLLSMNQFGSFRRKNKLLLFFAIFLPVVIVAITAIMGYNEIPFLLVLLSIYMVVSSSIYKGYYLIKTGVRASRPFFSVLIHLGLAILSIGILFTSTYRSEATLTFGDNDSVSIGDYTLTFHNNTYGHTMSYLELVINMNLTDSKGVTHILGPSLRENFVSKQISSKPKIYGSFKEDIYLAAKGVDDNERTIAVYVEPYIRLLWLGSFIMIFVGLLSFIYSLLKRKNDKVK